MHCFSLLLPIFGSFTFFETENNINKWCFIDPDCGLQKYFDTEKQALSYSEAYCRGIFIDTSKEQERYDWAEQFAQMLED